MECHRTFYVIFIFLPIKLKSFIYSQSSFFFLAIYIRRRGAGSRLSLLCIQFPIRAAEHVSSLDNFSSNLSQAITARSTPRLLHRVRQANTTIKRAVRMQVAVKPVLKDNSVTELAMLHRQVNNRNTYVGNVNVYFRLKVDHWQ